MIAHSRQDSVDHEQGLQERPSLLVPPNIHRAPSIVKLSRLRPGCCPLAAQHGEHASVSAKKVSAWLNSSVGRDEIMPEFIRLPIDVVAIGATPMSLATDPSTQREGKLSLYRLRRSIPPLSGEGRWSPSLPFQRIDGVPVGRRRMRQKYLGPLQQDR